MTRLILALLASLAGCDCPQTQRYDSAPTGPDDMSMTINEKDV